MGEIMDKKVELYHADLFVKNGVGTEEQRADLLKQVLYAKENNLETSSMSNDGCWRSTKKYKMDWLYEELRNLVSKATAVYMQSDKPFEAFVKQGVGLDFACWTNVNEVGSKNNLHTHTRDCWAGIYYIQAEGTGNLTFFNPANTLLQCNPKSPMIRSYGVTPKDGDLFIWPGWVPHEVEENKSNQQRINLAWGINFK